jgi:ankyrin repeat protein
VAQAPEKTLRQVADAARNNNLPAVSAMLRRGFSVTALSQHGAMPLHWAAHHGNADMMEEVLRYNPPIEAQDRQFHGTAMGWLIHGALTPWGFSTDDTASAHTFSSARALARMKRLCQPGTMPSIGCCASTS